MNWKLVFLLSLFGLVMGVATVFVIPANIEPVFWLVIFVVCAAIIAWNCTQKHFSLDLFLSLLNSVWIPAAHVALFETYLAGHPREAGFAAQMGSPRLMMLATGPVVGLVSGLVLGLFAFGASKLIKPGAAAS